ncbi:MAG: class I SAM-dependent methyltransferase [Syntrophomonadaceae bacterium]|nr:class I SAM-dependent methyltransferase [Syntrophomonadaceae bacterium]
MTSLYKRLALVAAMIPPGKRVADIGADHAQLALYLAENQIASRVIIGELPDGPYNRARTAVSASPAADAIEVRQGSGLQILARGEVDCVVLAGMGGETIVDILAYDWPKASSFPEYVFQPMSKPEVLRQHLSRQGWTIADERLVREQGKIYLVITSRPGHCPYHLTPLELEIGPVILKADSEIKKFYITRCRQKWQRIYQALLQSRLDRNRSRADRYRQKIIALEEVLNVSES